MQYGQRQRGIGSRMGGGDGWCGGSSGGKIKTTVHEQQ